MKTFANIPGPGAQAGTVWSFGKAAARGRNSLALKPGVRSTAVQTVDRPVRLCLAACSLATVLIASAHAEGPFALTSTLSNACAVVPHNAGLNVLPLTVTAWVKSSQLSNNVALVSKYDSGSQNGWQLYLTHPADPHRFYRVSSP